MNSVEMQFLGKRGVSGRNFNMGSGKRLFAWFVSSLALGLVFSRSPLLGAPNQIREGEMAGYLLVPNEKVPETYNAGFSMYVAAWPLLQEYPGHRFQTGLFGTWMFAQYDGPAPTNLYSDIEGGLGWWRDTRFATETPKFIMGGVAPDFIEWANGPGAGKGRDWDDPKGLYGVAQLSPWLLWPPDGLNLKPGTRGELFGYGYLPLPLTPAKSATAGKNVPTGDNCWTLFLNTRNFKGPVAFFTPYFWSHAALAEPRLAGMLLDTRPSQPNRALQMETQYVPSVQCVDEKGETYAHIARTFFPRGPEGDSVVVHRITSYSRKALWDAVRAWFEGGPRLAAPSTLWGPLCTVLTDAGARPGKSLRLASPARKARLLPGVRLRPPWPSAQIPSDTGGTTKWSPETILQDRSLVTLPEYFHLVTNSSQKAEWVAVRAEDVPAATGLVQFRFHRPREDRPEPYVTPDDAKSCWKRPGPVAGPFQAHPGDGSVVTYSWYRFADQPALQNAGLTEQERESLQARVEKLHRNWTKDRDYLPPPTIGTLADIDPALIVTPPPGLEAGYVPIVTRQAAAE